MNEWAYRRVSGTEGYAENADLLAVQYESISFDETHRDLLPLFPKVPCRVLDVGAGTGRDAAALAAMGHDVVAVEPTLELRRHGQRLHRSVSIVWVDDSLPDLNMMQARSGLFDLVLLTAVLMHLDADQRRRAIRRLSGLLRDGGLLALSLRHGPVPTGRRMFDVAAAEIRALALDVGLEAIHQVEREDMLGRPDIRWSFLALRKVVG